MVVSRRLGRGISTGAYSGCQMRAFAILGVAHCLGASLLWAHCRLLACYLNAGFFARAPRAFGLWFCICRSSRAGCRMRTGLMICRCTSVTVSFTGDAGVYGESGVSSVSMVSGIFWLSAGDGLVRFGRRGSLLRFGRCHVQPGIKRDLSSLGNLSSVSR